MEFLIRVESKGDDPMLTQPGDVVVACPDGWGWSVKELTNPHWRIVRVPLAATHVEALTANGLKRRRKWALDLNRLPRSLKLGVVNEFTQAEIIAATVQKA